MARTRRVSRGRVSRRRKAALPADDMATLERLVQSGRFVAIPPQKNAKPRKIAAASLEPDGAVLLYPAKETTDLGG